MRLWAMAFFCSAVVGTRAKARCALWHGRHAHLMQRALPTFTMSFLAWRAPHSYQHA